MKIRNNLGSFYSTLGGVKNQNTLSNKVGRVYHVITDERSSGYVDQSSIGTVYVLDYSAPNPNISLTEIQLTDTELQQAGLTKVKPLSPQFNYIPLLDEFVLLFALPNPNSDESDKLDLYYLNSINLWLNSHHNSQGVYNAIDNEGGIKLGEYILPSSRVPNLLPLEGDFTLNSRWGSGIRFTGAPYSPLSPDTPWIESADISGSGNPMTLIVNGYNAEDPLLPYIENIARDDSSIYLTSTQYIQTSSFNPSSIIDEKPSSFNPAGKSFRNSDKYGGIIEIENNGEKTQINQSQIIVSSNRITLNSAEDDIVMYSNTSIEMGANATIHLNGKENVYLNSKNVYLGKIKDNDLGNPEPVLLGYKTKELINEFLSTMIEFTDLLSSIDSTDPKFLGMSLATFSSGTVTKLKKQAEKINGILSSTTFTS